MMRLKLEVFAPAIPLPAEEAAAAAFEEARLAAFEKGYAAGWEDATAAEGASQHRLRAEIAHQIQDQAFSYHEARARALSELEPLLRAMAEVVLPRAAREALVPMVVEAIGELAAEQTDTPLQLRVSPADAPALEEVLRLQHRAPVAIVTEETLPPGQVWMRIARREAVVDIEDTCRRICDAVRNHFHSDPEIRQHG